MYIINFAIFCTQRGWWCKFNVELRLNDIAISTPEQFYLLYSLQIIGYFLDNHLERGTTRVARVALKRVAIVTATLSSELVERAMWREITFENCRTTPNLKFDESGKNGEK